MHRVRIRIRRRGSRRRRRHGSVHAASSAAWPPCSPTTTTTIATDTATAINAAARRWNTAAQSAANMPNARAGPGHGAQRGAEADEGRRSCVAAHRLPDARYDFRVARSEGRVDRGGDGRHVRHQVARHFGAHVVRGDGEESGSVGCDLSKTNLRHG
ncbi:hypothetical protein BKA81DRAFT_366549 [Phyllosticta paracitricarpa]